MVRGKNFKTLLHCCHFIAAAPHPHQTPKMANEKEDSYDVNIAAPTSSPTIENIEAAEEQHQFDADAALLLNITLICCTMLVRDLIHIILCLMTFATSSHEFLCLERLTS